MKCYWNLWATVPLFILGAGAAYPESSPESLEFFERHIRPALIDHCYECHGEDPNKTKGGLNLTYRDGIREGGASGPALVPRNPEDSLLFRALQYHDTDLQMPPNGKLADELVDRFEQWIRDGAVDPRDAPPTKEDLQEAVSWEAVRERREAWWSFQPIENPPVPADVPEAWRHNPVDGFIWHRMHAEELDPAERAAPHALVRRIHLVLTGLPPTPKEVDAFVKAAAADHDAAVRALVDRLLDTPAFGERWARHWMDWMRYAESHGSERDPIIPFAWRYRNYIIRALNEDVPYDALVREHLAGDKLPNPRINESTGVNESMVGTAQYRFVLHGFAPTDALDERVRFTDNQIDVVSKAFLGMTVSCARCHNHKFDPISQKDYYALFGIMASNRPATVTVDRPEIQRKNKAEITQIKAKIRAVLSENWLDASELLPDAMKKAEGPWKQALANATTNQNPLHPWQRLRHAEKPALETGWRELVSQWNGSRHNLKKRTETAYPLSWELGETSSQPWRHHGSGLDGTPAAAGAFVVRDSGEAIVRGIYPAGIYSHLYSTKDSGVLASPRFAVESKQVYLRIAGDGGAVQRYVIQDYPRDGTVYPKLHLNGGDWRWQRWDLAYWKGDTAHLEISTANDQAVLANHTPQRSWFGIAEAIVVADGQPAPRDEMAEFVAPLFRIEGQPKSPEDLLERYQTALRECITAWRDGAMDDEQARFLNYFVQHGLLPNSAATVPDAAPLLEKYRRLEAEIPYPTRAPGVLEGAPIDQPLFVRGNHNEPGDPVPRRFLEAIDETPYDGPGSGRHALAESILAENNPLAARVIANRLWHHTFGRGLVATPDNFGAMGEKPTHPDLFDYLATRMRTDGWSIKNMVRLLVTSRTFQLSAIAHPAARENDPENTLWSHALLRRMEAETIRDTMLAVSGRLDHTPPQQSVPGDANRRSVYVEIIRNSLDPFLTTFDAPVPVTTKGRRDATNVPAHALTLMNDPFIRSLAGDLAERVLTDDSLTDPNAKLARMFYLAMGRPPTGEEAAALLAYIDRAGARPSGREQDADLDAELTAIESRLADIEQALDEKVAAAVKADPDLAAREADEQRAKAAPDLWREYNTLKSRQHPLARLAAAPKPWVDVAQSIFSLKEFTYVR